MESSDNQAKANAITVANHYGNMRFAMFTVHVTILGAMINFAYTENLLKKLTVCESRIFVALIGICLSILFGLSQNRISNLVIQYQGAAYQEEAMIKPEGHECWSKLAGYSMLAPYYSVFIFWVLFIFKIF